MATKNSNTPADAGVATLDREELRGTNSVYAKIWKLRERISEVKSDKMEANRVSYNYLSERELVMVIRPVLQELKLVLIPHVVRDNTMEQDAGFDKEGRPRKAYLTTVVKKYSLVDAETGDSIEIESIGGGTDTMDKGGNKANTCATKNLLKDLCLIPSPERDDPDKTASSDSNSYFRGNSSSQYGARSNDPGSIVIKYGQFKGKSFKELFDENPEAVEEIANGAGNSKWLSGKAAEFLNSIK